MKRKAFIQIVGGTLIALFAAPDISKSAGSKMVSPCDLGFDFGAETEASDFSIFTTVVPRKNRQRGLRVAALKVVNGDIIARKDLALPNHDAEVAHINARVIYLLRKAHYDFLRGETMLVLSPSILNT